MGLLLRALLDQPPQRRVLGRAALALQVALVLVDRIARAPPVRGRGLLRRLAVGRAVLLLLDLLPRRRRLGARAVVLDRLELQVRARGPL